MARGDGPDPTAPGTTAPVWVSVRELRKSFGPATVLRDVAMDVHAGEIHGLVGQNGSGKSTLIKILSGAHRADGGSVVVNGTQLSNPVRPRELRAHGLAFVHQDLGLVGEYSVLENMRLGQYSVRRLSRRINWRSERVIARSTLARLHAEIDPDRLVNTLHPGERAIVAIGRALQNLIDATGCIVFDESTRALPRELLPDFYETVRSLAREGTAVIVVSHRLDEILALADSVTVLQDGVVVAGGRSTADLSESDLAGLVLGRELELLEERDVSAAAERLRAHRGEHTLRARGLSARQLRSFDLDVAAGEVVGVTGATGSGHAEIPYVLAGAVRHCSGLVSVDGRELELPVSGPPKMIGAGVALVPEDRVHEGLALTLNAEENLTLPRVRGRGRVLLRTGWQAAEFDEAVATLGIVPPQRHLPCSAFSGGNQQKLLVAKWLLNRPGVLLLHEPTQAVDVGARMDILHAIRTTAALGVCVVVCSIEAQDLAAVCDRVIVLRDGAAIATLNSPLSAEEITERTYSSVPAAA